MNQAVVETKSAWLSKINWTAGVAGTATVLNFFSGNKLNITPEQQLAIVTTISVIGNIATWVFKTWFTPTVTPSSVVAPAAIGKDIVAAVAASPGVEEVLIKRDANWDLRELVHSDSNPKVVSAQR